MNGIISNRNTKGVLDGCSDIWRSITRCTCDGQALAGKASSDLARGEKSCELLSTLSQTLGGAPLPALNITQVNLQNVVGGMSTWAESNFAEKTDSGLMKDPDNTAVVAAYSLKQSISMGLVFLRPLKESNVEGVDVSIDTGPGREIDIQTSKEDRSYTVKVKVDMVVHNKNELDPGTGKGKIIEKIPLVYEYKVSMDPSEGSSESSPKFGKISDLKFSLTEKIK